jgi:hypothetical protein
MVGLLNVEGGCHGPQRWGTVRGHLSIPLLLHSYPFLFFISPCTYVHMYIPQLSSPPPMLFPRVNIFYIHKSTAPMPNSQQLWTPHSHAYISCIGQVSDALGHICMTLWYPLDSHQCLYLGGLVLGAWYCNL